jgi:hypothetical protein
MDLTIKRIDWNELSEEQQDEHGTKTNYDSGPEWVVMHGDDSLPIGRHAIIVDDQDSDEQEAIIMGINTCGTSPYDVISSLTFDIYWIKDKYVEHTIEAERLTIIEIGEQQDLTYKARNKKAKKATKA